MADITIGYKGETIAEISASGTKTLKTAGKYCEDNITLQYVRPSAPTQNDDSVYLLRALPYTSYLKQVKKIIGGTIAWNQFAPSVESGNYSATSNATLTFSDGVATLHADAAAGAQVSFLIAINKRQESVIGHKYLFTAIVQTQNCVLALLPTGTSSQGMLRYAAYSTKSVLSYIWSAEVEANISAYFRGYTGGSSISSAIDYTVEKINVFDLSLLFGSTIADYIYSLEQANAGAGVAWFRNLFTKDYYPFDVGRIVSVKPSASKAISPDGNSYAIYPFDSTIELRGLLKLDANNNLYYDGDEYTPNGNIKRNYGTRAYQSGDESDSSVLTDGTNTIYKLSTPTTESATPYIELQATFPDGTEEFVDARTVPMPVSQDAEYFINENS